MAYNINRTSDSSSGYNVADGVLRQDFLSIKLIGKGYTNYGELIQENIVHVMENFANSVSPPNPIPGQLWFDTSTDLLFFWKSGGGWKDIQQPLDARIFNQHINADAKIAISKLAPTQPGKIIVGNTSASAIPTYVEMTGDINIDGNGVTKIQSNTVNTTELGSTINQDMTFGSVSTASNRSLDVIAHDAYIADIGAYGQSQGSGRLFVGQSSTVGGGIQYNGDNNPIMSGSVDHIAFYRRDAGADTEVFRYAFDNSWITFNDGADYAGELQSPRFRTGDGTYTYLEDNFLQLQGTGSPRLEMRSHDGGLPYIDFSSTLSGDYEIRMALESDGSLVIGSDGDTVVRSYAGDGNIASLEAYGVAQGTGMLYVGESINYGGGIAYNGDNVPSLPFTQDKVSFYRRAGGINAEVFYYPYNSNDVTFHGGVYAPNFYVNDGNTRITESTSSDAVRIQTSFGFGDIGSTDTTYFHLSTDRSLFKFNKRIEVADGIDINNSGTRLSEGSTNTLRIESNSYRVDIGARDSNWVYYDTTSAGHYFGAKTIRTDSKLEVGSSGSYFLAQNGSVTTNGYIASGSYLQAKSGEVYVGNSGGSGDTVINFRDNNSSAWRALRWDDSANRFSFDYTVHSPYVVGVDAYFSNAPSIGAYTAVTTGNLITTLSTINNYTYTRIIGGMKIIAAQFTYSGDDTFIYFPSSFTTECFAVVVQMEAPAYDVGVTSVATNGFQYNPGGTPGGTKYYIAIGV